ncbi:hypothetical protein [Jeongeupia sp. USM3]|uniref:hypothetical protein n=1 Tax=Jeongeupia sp. USM3 TaxID=1906741 RepID=UPI00089E042D|nr:hypothetical protein [Jeongeupia sp. USM3]AOY00169.1 hypothetical protein BJP62_06750 [Jeongeupia sp. USM3]
MHRKTLTTSLLALLWLSVPTAGWSATTPAPEQTASLSAGAQAAGWPRLVNGQQGEQIYVYQPQLDALNGDTLTGRSAVRVSGKNGDTFGVIWFSARADIAKDRRVVTLSQYKITKSNFPTAGKDEGRYLSALRAAVPKEDWTVPYDALAADLQINQAEAAQAGQAVKNDPPAIIYSNRPSLLVMIDGEPALRSAGGKLMRVINTSALLVLDQASGNYYLWAVERWYQSGSATGPWQVATKPPTDALNPLRESLLKANKIDPMSGKSANGESAFDPSVVPAIYVATRPTELLQSKGEPQYAPIPGTQLLYMSNSPSDIFVQIGSQQLYVLVSGRWFTAGKIDGPWQYVPGDKLPADFARIPTDHPMAGVLVSVPGTAQASEARIANSVPQTAQVKRSVKPDPVAYDGGEPQWKPIDDTPLQYAYNTATPIIRVDARSYYLVQNGVWFVATSAAGPWSVAASVPAVIYSIPVSSPMHYVTYVRVYSATPDVVYVGYTPGYYGTVVSSDGVVVYGTGYVYPTYVGTVWYPAPYTYGFGAGFAWGTATGFAFGFAMGAWMSPWYWGGGGCCWGGGNTYNINVTNNYNRWGHNSVITGPNNTYRTGQIGQTHFATKQGSGDLYAGRDGQVYKRDSGGQWQKYQGNGNWSNIDKQQAADNVKSRAQNYANSPQGQQRIQNAKDFANSPQGQQAAQRAKDWKQSPQGQQAAQNFRENHQSLDGQFQARSAGDQRAGNFQRGNAGGWGGGSHDFSRFGGGGFGGFHGGGFRRR